MRITPTLFNFTLNPNAGLRLDMRDMFETVARSNEFPLRLNGEDIVDFLQIDTVLACLPGGRGCVGKERLGRTLHDRQVALVDSSGIKYNPARPDAAYGFLHLVGFVQYKDGKQNKIVIPVEPSGVIGLRAGSSSLSAFNPNENLTQNRLLQSISELETILFAFLNIPKRNEPKMAMLNAMFNVFTDKTGKDRPRITNFVRFLRDFYNTLPELKDTYHKGTTPWLRIQGGPTVMKSSFKLKFENGEELQKNFKKDVNSPPTFTISPYGHVEFLGAKSFTGIKTAYNIIVRAARIIQEQELVTFQEPEEAQEATGTTTATTRTRVKKTLNISKYFPITFSKKDRALFINKKPCDKYPKNFVTYLANINGIPARGKISTVCQRLHDLPQLVQIAGEKEANNKQNKNTIRTKLNRKGVPQTTIDGRQCKTMSKKNLKKYAEKYDIDPTLPVKEICRLLAIAVNKNNNNNQAAEGSQRSSVRSGGTVSTRSGVGSQQKNSVRSGGTVSTRSGVGSEQKNSVRSGGTVSTRSGVGSKQKNSVRSGGTVSTRSGVGSEQKNSVRSGGTVSTRSGVGSKQKNSVRSGGTVSTRSGVGSEQKNSVRSGGSKNKSLPENPMLRFAGSKQTINFLKVYNPDKSLYELQRIAMNIWTNDMNGEQQNQWIQKHVRNSPVFSIVGSPSGSKKSTPNSAFLHSLYGSNNGASVRSAAVSSRSKKSSVRSGATSRNSDGRSSRKSSARKSSSASSASVNTPNSAFLHSLYGSNNGASVRSAAVSSRSKKSSVRSGATSRNSDGRSSRKSSARKSSSSSSASVNTPNSAFLHSLYDNNGGASVRSGAVSSRSKKNNSSARTASVNAPNSAFLHSLYDNNGGASVRSGAVSSRSKKNNSSVRSKNNGSIRSIRSSRSSNSNSDAAMMRFVTHRTIITRLRNNHPNKSENQLVALAKDAWKNDYDHEARRNWLANHPVVLPNRNVGIDPNSEAAMLRFTKHRSVIGRLQNNHPDKTLNQLVALAKDAWRNDYANRDARLNWLENHDRNNNMEPFTPKTPPTLKTRVVPKTSYYVVEPVKKQLKKVLCASKLLTQLKKLAEDQGVSTQGTKKDICDRIAQFRNAKGRPMIIVPSNKVTERTTLCENKTLKFLRNLAEQMRLGTTGTKAQLCKRMASTLLVVA